MPTQWTRLFAMILATHFVVPLAAQTPGSGKTPVAVLKEGEPVRWLMSDGRVAQLMVNRYPEIALRLPFAISEMGCEREVIVPKCHFLVPFQMTEVQVRWSEHADPTKMDSVVRFSGTPLETSETFGPYSFRHFPGDYGNLPTLELVCDDFGWTGAGAEAPASLRWESWSAEQMMNNPETDTMENTTLGGIFDLQFERVDAHRLRLRSTGDWYAVPKFYTTFLFFLGDVFHIVDEVVDSRGQRQICQTALKPDLASLQAEAGKKIGTLPRRFTPYAYGSDFLWSRHLTDEFFQYALTRNEEELQ